MSLGEILDKTIEMYRRRFLLFAGIAALPAAAMLGLHAVDIAWVHTDRWIDTSDDGWMFERLLLAYGYYHISGFLALLVLPAFVRAGTAALFGESTTIWPSLRFANAHWRSYLWLAFLAHIAALILPEALAFGVFYGTGTLLDKLNLIGDSPSVVAIVLLLLEIPAGFLFVLWATALFSFSIPAAALEQFKGFKALRRSWVLTSGSRWRIVFARVMVLLVAWALEISIQYLIRWIAILLYRGHSWTGFNADIYSLAIYFFYAVIASIVGPLFPIAITLLYYDQRVRKEGFDVEVMMQRAGLEAEAGGSGANGLVPGLAGFDRGQAPAWSQFVKFIRSLRGFD